MNLLVIVVTYNAMRWAKHCFDSLQTSTIVPDVFVVDNGSTDGTQEFIQKNYPKMFFFQSEENLGFGAANNIGLKYALENKYDFVYLLNQDAWVLPETFEKLMKLSCDNPEFGLLSPMQMNADLYHIDKNFCMGLFSYQNKEIINDMYNNKLKDIYETTPFVMAAHWFLTRRCIEKIGGFSKTFKHYGEDNNYAERVLFHGFKVGVTPLERVVHDRGERVDDTNKKIYLNYIYLLLAMSSPFNKKKEMIVSFFRLLSSTIRYKSFRPIIYVLKIIFHLILIYKNKKKTISGTCFLD